jgi:hypothetical protein
MVGDIKHCEEIKHGGPRHDSAKNIVVPPAADPVTTLWSHPVTRETATIMPAILGSLGRILG